MRNDIHRDCNHPADVTPTAVAAAIELVVIGRIERRIELFDAGNDAVMASYTDPWQRLLLYMTIGAAAFSALRRTGRDEMSFVADLVAGDSFPGGTSRRTVRQILDVAREAESGASPSLDELLDDVDALKATPEVILGFTAEVIGSSTEPDDALGNLRHVLVTALSYACPDPSWN